MSRHTIGSGPVEAAYVEKMKSIARGIDKIFNEDPQGRTVGFILMVFPFGALEMGDHHCNYMSNAERDDVIEMLREQIAYFEGQPDTLSGRG
jgi:hypothetical protein